MNKIVIPMEHKLLILYFCFVYLSNTFNEVKYIKTINNTEAIPLMTSLNPTLLPFPTIASKNANIHEYILQFSFHAPLK